MVTDTYQRSVIYHVLHADGYFIVGTERAVEPHDVGRVALMEHLQFPHNLVPHRRLDVQHYHLRGGERVGGQYTAAIVWSCRHFARLREVSAEAKESLLLHIVC